MTRFLQLALLNSLFLLALGTAGVLYHGHIHAAGIVAIAAVLAVYIAGAGYALRIAWRGGEVRHVELAASICPAIGIAGVASGFLIALSGGTDDVQQRVVGAASGLAATVVAVLCMVLLDVQAHMLKRPCRCGKG